MLEIRSLSSVLFGVIFLNAFVEDSYSQFHSRQNQSSSKISLAAVKMFQDDQNCSQYFSEECQLLTDTILSTSNWTMTMYEELCSKKCDDHRENYFLCKGTIGKFDAFTKAFCFTEKGIPCIELLISASNEKSPIIQLDATCGYNGTLCNDSCRQNLHNINNYFGCCAQILLNSSIDELEVVQPSQFLNCGVDLGAAEQCQYLFTNASNSTTPHTDEVNAGESSGVGRLFNHPGLFLTSFTAVTMAVIL